MSLPWPLKSPCCCKDVQRGELTCAAPGKAVPVPSALEPPTAHIRHVFLCCWGSTGSWGMACKELSEVSFHRDTVSQWGGRVSDSLHTPMGRPQWLGSQRSWGRLGPFTSWPLMLAWSLASWALPAMAAVRQFDEPKMGFCMLISTS